MSNPPADPKPRPEIMIHIDRGGDLRATGDLEISLAFYRDEYVLTTDPDGQLNRSDFLRGPGGKVAWLRDGGRLWAKQG